MSDITVEQVVGEMPEAAPLWRALADGRLELQRCPECDRRRFPPIASCPYCSATAGEWEEVQPRGRVYSWVVTHFAFDPALKDELPYTIATIELDAGPKIFARLTGCDPDELREGLEVEGYFHDEGRLPYLRFRPADNGAGS